VRSRRVTMRFFEGVIRHSSTLPTGEDVRAVASEPIYNLDEIVHYTASEAGMEWDLPTLPVVEPPFREGLVLADFNLPAAVLDYVRELQESTGMPVVEEWVEGARERSLADRVGAVFRRIDDRPEQAVERLRGALARWAKDSPEMARAYRATITLARWEPRELDNMVLLEEGTYDWAYAVSDDGSPLGLAELEVPGLDLAAAPAGERRVFEGAGIEALVPFLLSFARLACENVVAEAVQPASDDRPSYVRPVIRPAFRRGAVWEVDIPTVSVEPGYFVKLSAEDRPPEGLGPGLYWAKLR
jgi:hypothetical protein